jgi:uncharacterized damage-inducible protein DinB
MTIKVLLLAQFHTCYDQNGWFVAVKNAVQNLSARDAALKPENADNSIWGILAHLNFYNERYLKRFKGETLENLELENSGTFAGAENALEKEWNFEVEKFDSVMSEWRKHIKAAKDTRFDEPVSDTNKSLCGTVIADIAE